MSKEYQAYKFFATIYVLGIANIVILLSKGVWYYVWFLSSIFVLFSMLFAERQKFFNLTKHPSQYKLSFKFFYIVSYILTYPRHYDSYMNLNPLSVVILQLTNLLLVIMVYSIEEKEKPQSGMSSLPG